MPRRLRLLPELGANALEPRNSGGVSLIDATSKASGPGETGGCAWIGKTPSKPAPLTSAAVSLIEQMRGIFTDVGLSGSGNVGKDHARTRPVKTIRSVI